MEAIEMWASWGAQSRGMDHAAEVIEMLCAVQYGPGR